jgi:hypothetical protein
VLWEGRVHRFEVSKGGRARILEFGSGDLREVSVTELRGVSSLPISELDQRLDRLRTIDTVDWSTAQQREAIIGHAINGDGPDDRARRCRGDGSRSVRAHGAPSLREVQDIGSNDQSRRSSTRPDQRQSALRIAVLQPGEKQYLIARVGVRRGVLLQAAASAAGCVEIGSGA